MDAFFIDLLFRKDTGQSGGGQLKQYETWICFKSKIPDVELDFHNYMQKYKSTISKWQVWT